MARATIAIHEAGHALAAYCFNIAVTSVSVKPKETHLGITNFNASGFESDLDCAVVFACGPMANRMYEGRTERPERINWLDVDNPDIEKSLWFLDRAPNPLLARRLVELRARALLFTRWQALQALAAELDRRGVLLGAQVEQLLHGTRRARDKPRRSIDPSARYATVGRTTVRDKQGRPISLRRWATVLDSVGHDTRRALELVAGEERKDR